MSEQCQPAPSTAPATTAMDKKDGDSLSIAVIQSSFAVGNIDENLARIRAFHAMAGTLGCDLVVFSEMCITGYPPEDLLDQASFQEAAMQAVGQCAALTRNGPAMLVGSLWRETAGSTGSPPPGLYNTVFLLADGEVAGRQYKHHLPNYGVFDELRNFLPGPLPRPLLWRGIRLGVMICEDMWHADVAASLARQGAQILLCLNASPFERGKQVFREEIALARVHETSLPLLYVNQVGGHDDLVFDGGGFAICATDGLSSRMAAFHDDFAILRASLRGSTIALLPGAVEALHGQLQACYLAMVTGLRDFVRRNNYAGVVLGISGGIDSALAAAVAVDAVGKDKVRGLRLPSPYTSQQSMDDAETCARLLDIRLDTVAIGPGMQAFDSMFSGLCSGDVPLDASRCNQARLRASILTALSWEENLLLLNTGNKSEMAVGYTTFYGDLCGHYAILNDLYKTAVYDVARWRNSQGEVIPAAIFIKPPSAELFPGQTDQADLPPYPELDAMLLELIEKRRGIAEVAALGFDHDEVLKVSMLVHAAEQKRRQAPPGPKLSPMSFWRDRRSPIANGWYVAQHARFTGK